MEVDIIGFSIPGRHERKNKLLVNLGTCDWSVCVKDGSKEEYTKE